MVAACLIFRLNECRLKPGSWTAKLIHDEVMANIVKKCDLTLLGTAGIAATILSSRNFESSNTTAVTASVHSGQHVVVRRSLKWEHDIKCRMPNLVLWCLQSGHGFMSPKRSGVHNELVRIVMTCRAPYLFLADFKEVIRAL